MVQRKLLQIRWATIHHVSPKQQMTRANKKRFYCHSIQGLDWMAMNHSFLMNNHVKKITSYFFLQCHRLIVYYQWFSMHGKIWRLVCLSLGALWNDSSGQQFNEELVSWDLSSSAYPSFFSGMFGRMIRKVYSQNQLLSFFTQQVCKINGINALWTFLFYEVISFWRMFCINTLLNLDPAPAKEIINSDVKKITITEKMYSTGLWTIKRGGEGRRGRRERELWALSITVWIFNEAGNYSMNTVNIGGGGGSESCGYRRGRREREVTRAVDFLIGTVILIDKVLKVFPRIPMLPPSRSCGSFLKTSPKVNVDWLVCRLYRYIFNYSFNFNIDVSSSSNINVC